ncbi:MAG TPA: hypothetical protein VEX86_06280, partial [Longimicrobium sp.]|nr:hypothetical protein [Longimicrobium sp.]
SDHAAMALVPCPDCEQQVPDTAPGCKACGRTMAPVRRGWRARLFGSRPASARPAVAPRPRTPGRWMRVLGIVFLMLVSGLHVAFVRETDAHLAARHRAAGMSLATLRDVDVRQQRHLARAGRFGTHGEIFPLYSDYDFKVVYRVEVDLSRADGLRGSAR